MDVYKGKLKDIEYESTFPSWIKFTCKRCGYCCTSNDIELTSKEISIISKTQEMNESEFVNSNAPNKCLKNVEGKCLFLEEKNKCKIYENRPLTCRKFPYHVYFEGQKEAIIDYVFCPHFLDRNNDKFIPDFNFLISSTLDDYEGDPEIFKFIPFVKEKLEKDNDSQKKFLIKIQNIVQNSNSINEIYNTIDIDDENEPKEKESINDFNLRTLAFAQEFFQNTCFKGFLYNDNIVYFMQINSTKILTENLDLDEIDFNDLHTKKYSIEMKNLRQYFNLLFKKKLLQYELYRYYIDRLNEKKIPNPTFFYKEFTKNLLLLMNFIALILSNVKGQDIINAETEKEIIVFVEQYLLSLCLKIK